MRAKYLDEFTLGRLKNAIKGSDWLPMRLMIETGVRVGDAVKARKRDFYRERNGVPHFHWVAEKTDKRGKCPISETLYNRVQVLPGGPSAYIFPGRGKSGHITRQCLWARIDRACKDYGIEKAGVSPHSLRKVYAVTVRRERGLQAAKDALQHTHTATAALYAYSDEIFSPDQPITWGEIDLVVQYFRERFREES